MKAQLKEWVIQGDRRAIDWLAQHEDSTLASQMQGSSLNSRAPLRGNGPPVTTATATATGSAASHQQWSNARLRTDQNFDQAMGVATPQPQPRTLSSTLQVVQEDDDFIDLLESMNEFLPSGEPSDTFRDLSFRASAGSGQQPSMDPIHNTNFNTTNDYLSGGTNYEELSRMSSLGSNSSRDPSVSQRLSQFSASSLNNSFNNSFNNSYHNTYSAGGGTDPLPSQYGGLPEKYGGTTPSVFFSGSGSTGSSRQTSFNSFTNPGYANSFNSNSNSNNNNKMQQAQQQRMQMQHMQQHMQQVENNRFDSLSSQSGKMEPPPSAPQSKRAAKPPKHSIPTKPKRKYVKRVPAKNQKEPSMTLNISRAFSGERPDDEMRATNYSTTSSNNSMSRGRSDDSNQSIDEDPTERKMFIYDKIVTGKC